MATQAWPGASRQRACGICWHWLAALALVCASVACASAEVAGDSVQHIRMEQVLEAGPLYPAALPAPEARWLPRALPDNWASTRPGQGGHVWYRLRFDGPPAGQPSAIYLPNF